MVGKTIQLRGSIVKYIVLDIKMTSEMQGKHRNICNVLC